MWKARSGWIAVWLDRSGWIAVAGTARLAAIDWQHKRSAFRASVGQAVLPVLDSLRPPAFAWRTAFDLH